MFTGLLERAAELPEALLLALTLLLAFGESAFLLDLLVPGEVGLVFLAAISVVFFRWQVAGGDDVALPMVEARHGR